MLATTSAMLVTLGLLGTLLIGTRLFQRRYSLHPKYARKIVHTGSGLVALSFPWLFEHEWAVVATCVACSLAVAIARRARGVNGDMTGILGRARHGLVGEFGLSFAVAMLFVLSKGDVLLYCTPLLIVTFADPAAAIIGRRYGRRHYQTGKTRKTLEGSITFFLIAVTTTFGLSAIATDVGRIESLLIALLVGLLTSVSEAVASRGEDNITVPLVAFVVLKASVSRLGGDTGLYVGLILSVTLVIALLQRRTALI
jgi:dolichol kinase